MHMQYCPNCQRRVGFRKVVGFGTKLFLVISFLCCLAMPIMLIAWCFTAVVLLLARPSRCMSCGNTSLAASTTSTVAAIRADPKNTLIGLAFVAGMFLLAALIGGLFNLDSPATNQPVRIVDGGGLSAGTTSRVRPAAPQGVTRSINSGSVREASESLEPEGDRITVSSNNPTYQTYRNGRFGFRIDYPKSFVQKEPPANGDGLSFTSPDGKAELTASGGNNYGTNLTGYYSDAMREVDGELGYHAKGGTWFVLTWKRGDILVYRKVFVGAGSVNSFTFTFPESQKLEYEMIVTKVEKSFHHGEFESAQ